MSKYNVRNKLDYFFCVSYYTFFIKFVQPLDIVRKNKNHTNYINSPLYIVVFSIFKISLVFLKRKNYSIYLFPQHNKRTGGNPLSIHRGVSSYIFLTHVLLYTLFVLSQVECKQFVSIFFISIRKRREIRRVEYHYNYPVLFLQVSNRLCSLHQ